MLVKDLLGRGRINSVGHVSIVSSHSSDLTHFGVDNQQSPALSSCLDGFYIHVVMVGNCVDTPLFLSKSMASYLVAVGIRIIRSMRGSIFKDHSSGDIDSKSKLAVGLV